MAPRWTFAQSVDADFDILPTWFDSATAVRRWGGPEFEYPFTPATFRRDCHWPGMASFSLRDEGGKLLAFGQFYDRERCIHLARIAVEPRSRGRGTGREFVSRLMVAGRKLLHLPAYSLFVYRDNEAALRCYRSLGFETRPNPAGHRMADVCSFMIRPVDAAGCSDNRESMRGA